jgi:hypothetical protein
MATHELLRKAKEAWDELLAADAYTLIWNANPAVGQLPAHAHLHVIPRFDDEPFADRGGRSAIKVPENRRPDRFRPGAEERSRSDCRSHAPEHAQAIEHTTRGQKVHRLPTERCAQIWHFTRAGIVSTRRSGAPRPRRAVLTLEVNSATGPMPYRRLVVSAAVLSAVCGARRSIGAAR